MKPYLKLIILYFLLLLGAFLFLRLMAVWLLDRPLDAPILATGVVWVVLFSLIYFGVLIREFKPRLDYIRKPGIEPPNFNATITCELEVPGNTFSIQKLHDELEQHYEVTFMSEEQQIIKLRDRFTLQTFGACSFIRYQPEQETVVVASYPISNRTMRQGGEGTKQNEAITQLILTG